MYIAIRPAAVAGMFYPDGTRHLDATVRSLLAAQSGHNIHPKALIVPHAGYVYSGAAAASAYVELAQRVHKIRRVVMLGPAHRVAVRGLAASSARAFRTPLGDVPLDRQAINDLLPMPQVNINDAAHAQEHCIEVQLPFLQRLFADADVRFRLVPLLVGAASDHEVAQVLDRLWGGEETLIVISSDLSHYHPYDEARQIDHWTAELILGLQTLGSHEQACGATPINGLIEVARRRGLQPELLALCNSGDTAGDRSRVVGYAAFAFSEGTKT